MVAWVQERRAAAADIFAKTGFPNTRMEEWRFTNVAPIVDGQFLLAEGPTPNAAKLVAGVAIPGSVRLTIVNGEFVAALSDLSHLPKGVRIASLRDGARDGSEGLEQHLAKTFDIATHPFAALNTSLLDESGLSTQMQ